MDFETPGLIFDTHVGRALVVTSFRFQFPLLAMACFSERGGL